MLWLLKDFPQVIHLWFLHRNSDLILARKQALTLFAGFWFCFILLIVLLTIWTQLIPLGKNAVYHPVCCLERHLQCSSGNQAVIGTKPGAPTCKACAPVYWAIFSTLKPFFLFSFLFWGHTLQCSRFTPDSALRNHSSGYSGDHLGCQRSKTKARQVPYPLY